MINEGEMLKKKKKKLFQEKEMANVSIQGKRTEH